MSPALVFSTTYTGPVSLSLGASCFGGSEGLGGCLSPGLSWARAAGARVKRPASNAAASMVSFMGGISWAATVARGGLAAGFGSRNGRMKGGSGHRGQFRGLGAGEPQMFHGQDYPERARGFGRFRPQAG